ncbi:MAG TPA: sensor histidine kinase, partial [Salinimicrobium sp.]|nr:sensor histidine kinase [Salinimicrobium sp.]
MNFSEERSFRRWFIIISSLIITILIVWNAVIFFQSLKEDERRKMNIWTSAQLSLIQANEDMELDPLIFTVINSNTTIPTVWVDENGNIFDVLNVPEEVSADSLKLQDFLLELRSENVPIEMDLGSGKVHYVYYGKSPLLNKLKYYPLVLYFIIILFIAVIYFFYTTT